MNSTDGHAENTPAHDLQPLLDIHAVAARLGVTERHMRRLVAERRIPYLKWGHLLRFDPAEIEQWIESSRVPSRPSA